MTAATETTGYLERALELMRAVQLRRGEVAELHVRHDDDCPRLADPPGRCRCHPDITLVRSAR